jgi:hypothetical protein
MRYITPEVTMLATALTAIESSSSGTKSHVSGLDSATFETISAYADWE